MIVGSTVLKAWNMISGGTTVAAQPVQIAR